eukprot:236302-Alexandrium_andersonii.AAC.1
MDMCSTGRPSVGGIRTFGSTLLRRSMSYCVPTGSGLLAFLQSEASARPGRHCAGGARGR